MDEGWQAHAVRGHRGRGRVRDRIGTCERAGRVLKDSPHQNRIQENLCSRPTRTASACAGAEACRVTCSARIGRAQKRGVEVDTQEE
eukprot:916755-Rhodomonas_salina.1